MSNPYYPKYPIYVPSKGRSKYLMTSTALNEMEIGHHFLIVEPSEVDLYITAVRERKLPAEVLPLDMNYKRTYERCDRNGQGLPTGSGPARNFGWEHSIAAGHARHWMIDDNIDGIYRLHRNQKLKCLTPAPFRAMEDFCDRYVNVAMAGPSYDFLIVPYRSYPPYYLNTRIFSCNLILNKAPFRFRGVYNEDLILSLDMLKAGWCTIEFKAFLQGKQPTQSMPGGNTAEIYHPTQMQLSKAAVALYERERAAKGGRYRVGGTVAKSQMVASVHPDVARVAWRFGRVHHYVNYRPFKANKLILRRGVVLPEGSNNYGMVLRSLNDDKT